MYNQEKVLKKLIDYTRKSYRAETEHEKKARLSKPFISLHKQMHTNLPNEITGAYYKEQGTLKFYIKNTIIILCLLALPFILADLIFGAETVTYWIANLF